MNVLVIQPTNVDICIRQYESSRPIILDFDNPSSWTKPFTFHISNLTSGNKYGNMCYRFISIFHYTLTSSPLGSVCDKCAHTMKLWKYIYENAKWIHDYYKQFQCVIINEPYNT